MLEIKVFQNLHTMNLSKNNYVSIILVNWNGAKWLPKCLKSLTHQTYSKTEVILVDNASTDNSLEYVSKTFPEVKIYRNKKNVGFSAATNLGIEFARGEYLLIINIDTWVEKDFVEKLYRFYQEHDFFVISPTEKRYDKKPVKILNTTIDPTGMPAYYLPKDKKHPFYLCTSYFLSKKNYKISGGFDSNHFLYMEDVDWFWRINLLDLKYCYVPDVFIFHQGGSSVGSGLSYNAFLWRNQNSLQTLIKNYSSISLLLILPMYFLQNILEMTILIGMGKVNLALSYLQSWRYNLINLKKIYKKRKWIQKRRRISDFSIFLKMYPGSGKLLHFRRIYKWI